MPAAVAIPAVLGAVGVGGSIFSGITGSSAAKNAANTQVEYAKAAGDKVEGAARDANPAIINNAANASDMALRSAGGVLDSAKDAAAGVNTATTAANNLLRPYADAGANASNLINTGLSSDFNKTPTAADIQIDPGFAARLAAQQTVIERSAAARGGASSGAALMDLAKFGQTEASNEYQRAFDRFETDRQNRFNNLNTVAGRGASVAGQEGTNLIGGAKYGGDINTDAAKTNLQANEYAGSTTYDAAKTAGANTINAADRAGEYLTQQGNAKASGIVGSANAVNSAVGTAIGAVTSAGNLYNALKNPGYTRYGTGNMNTSGGSGGIN